jgi:hypothetical protein
MAGSTKDSWGEVGERFSEWGRMVAERHRSLGQEEGSAPEEDRRKLDEAVEAVIRELDQAFKALGDTFRDPEGKRQLGLAVRSFGDALSTTFTEAGEEIRKRFGGSPPSAP